MLAGCGATPAASWAARRPRGWPAVLPRCTRGARCTGAREPTDSLLAPSPCRLRVPGRPLCQDQLPVSGSRSARRCAVRVAGGGGGGAPPPNSCGSTSPPRRPPNPPVPATEPTRPPPSRAAWRPAPRCAPAAASWAAAALQGLGLGFRGAAAESPPPPTQGYTETGLTCLENCGGGGGGGRGAGWGGGGGGGMGGGVSAASPVKKERAELVSTGWPAAAARPRLCPCPRPPARPQARRTLA